jgi:hypothetical protein
MKLMNALSAAALASSAMIAMAAAFAAPAAAAPQVLGVMASQGPVPLACEGGECRAEVTAFCLQESRPVPPEGTAYRAVGTAPMSLVLSRADGSTLTLDASQHARLSSRRGFTAVSIAVPHSLLARHGAIAASIEIGPEVTVAPVAVAGDPAPQSEEELALAAGPLRSIAAERLEQGAAADAARLTQRLINALPRQDEETTAIRDGLWDVATGGVTSADPKGLAMARRSYEGCQAALETGYMKNLRHCLELQHGEMMIERNHAFWREIQPGS